MVVPGAGAGPGPAVVVVVAVVEVVTVVDVLTFGAGVAGGSVRVGPGPVSLSEGAVGGFVGTAVISGGPFKEEDNSM